MASCTVPICFDWIVLGHAVVTIEATIDVYRNDDLIEVDEQSAYVVTVCNGKTDRLHVTANSPSEEARFLFTLIMREVSKHDWTGPFDRALAEIEQSESDDRTDDAYQARREHELADAA